MGREEKEAGGRGSLHRIVDDALDAFISVLDQHTLEDMAGASQATAARESGGRSGKTPVRGAPGRSRRGPQQSAPARSIG
jgi:hypothetical protein